MTAIISLLKLCRRNEAEGRSWGVYTASSTLGYTQTPSPPSFLQTNVTYMDIKYTLVKWFLKYPHTQKSNTTTTTFS